MKKIIVMIAIASLVLLVACTELSITGTWYKLGADPDNEYNQLVLTEDGTFVLGDSSGEWTLSEEQLILSNARDAECFDIIDYADVGKRLLDSMGYEWVNNYDEASDAYDEAVAEREAEESEEIAEEERLKDENINYIKENIVGIYTTAAVKDEYGPIEFEIFSNGIYCYSCNDSEGEPIEESGYWEIDESTYDEYYAGVSMEIVLDADYATDKLADYKIDTGNEAVLSNLYLYLNTDDYSIYLEGDGVGVAMGDIYIPDGRYEK